MHTVLPETKDGLVAIRATGRIDREDMDAIGNIWEQAIARHGKLKVFWEMTDFHGWTPAGAWADTKTDVRHAGDFTRIAMVGEKQWHGWMATLMKPFTSAKVKYFDSTERGAALRWVQER